MEEERTNEEIKETKKESRISGAFARFLELFRTKVIKTLLRIRKRYLLAVIALTVAILLLSTAILLLSVSAAVCNKVEDRIVTQEVACGSDFDCIIVLGCRVWEDGSMSDMLADRVNLGISLYQGGASQTLLMSGDSEDATEYDEVGTMKKAAQDAGISSEQILTDSYGLSTYDSMIRLRDVYGMKRVLIVTQEYHLYRALYIAEKLGMDAWGVPADTRTYRNQLWRDLREIPARFKDVYYSLLQPSPKYEF